MSLSVQAGNLFGMLRQNCGCLQEVQQILIPAIQKFSQSRPYEANSYLARLQAEAASSHADALVSEVDTMNESLSQVTFAMRGSQGGQRVQSNVEL